MQTLTIKWNQFEQAGTPARILPPVPAPRGAARTDATPRRVEIEAVQAERRRQGVVR